MTEIQAELAAALGLGLNLDFVDVPAPAAGANALIPDSFDVRSRMWAVVCTVATDANAANRFVSLDYIGRSVAYVRNAGGVVWTANTAGQVFVWTANRGQAEWAANTPALFPLLPLALPLGIGAQITVDNKQVGDTITGIHAVIERLTP